MTPLEGFLFGLGWGAVITSFLWCWRQPNIATFREHADQAMEVVSE